MNLTIEKLNEVASEMDISRAIEFGKEFYGEYPDKPKKPVLNPDSNSNEVLKYAELLKNWEIDFENYSNSLKMYNETRSKVNQLLKEFIMDQVGIEVVPEKYREKLYSKAIEYSNSYDHYEIYTNLNNLIEIFE
jgi:hypothetical protein